MVPVEGGDKSSASGIVSAVNCLIYHIVRGMCLLAYYCTCLLSVDATSELEVTYIGTSADPEGPFRKGRISSEFLPLRKSTH